MRQYARPCYVQVQQDNEATHTVAPHYIRRLILAFARNTDGHCCEADSIVAIRLMERSNRG